MTAIFITLPHPPLLLSFPLDRLLIVLLIQLIFDAFGEETSILASVFIISRDTRKYTSRENRTSIVRSLLEFCEMKSMHPLSFSLCVGKIRNSYFPDIFYLFQLILF